MCGRHPVCLRSDTNDNLGVSRPVGITALVVATCRDNFSDTPHANR